MRGIFPSVLSDVMPIYVGYVFAYLWYTFLACCWLLNFLPLPVASCQCREVMVVCYAVNLSLPQRSRLSVCVCVPWPISAYLFKGTFVPSVPAPVTCNVMNPAFAF